MGFVLTSASSVTCGHLPPASGIFLVQSAAKLWVGGASVLRATDLTAVTIATCGTVIVTSEKKCTKVTGITAGPATKLRAGGEPVLLDTLAGVTDGLAGGVLQALLGGTAGQTKLQAV